MLPKNNGVIEEGGLVGWILSYCIEYDDSVRSSKICQNFRQIL